MIDIDLDKLPKLKRAELQALCKQLGIKSGNKKNADIIEDLRQYVAEQQKETVEESGSEEESESEEENTDKGEDSPIETKDAECTEESTAASTPCTSAGSEEKESEPEREEESNENTVEDDEHAEMDEDTEEHSEEPSTVFNTIENDAENDSSEIALWLKEHGFSSELAEAFVREQVNTWDMVENLSFEAIRALGCTVGTCLRLQTFIKEKFSPSHRTERKEPAMESTFPILQNLERTMESMDSRSTELMKEQHDLRDHLVNLHQDLTTTMDRAADRAPVLEAIDGLRACLETSTDTSELLKRLDSLNESVSHIAGVSKESDISGDIAQLKETLTTISSSLSALPAASEIVDGVTNSVQSNLIPELSAAPLFQSLEKKIEELTQVAEHMQQMRASLDDGFGSMREALSDSSSAILSQVAALANATKNTEEDGSMRDQIRTMAEALKKIEMSAMGGGNEEGNELASKFDETLREIREDIGKLMNATLPMHEWLEERKESRMESNENVGPMPLDSTAEIKEHMEAVKEAIKEVSEKLTSARSSPSPSDDEATAIDHLIEIKYSLAEQAISLKSAMENSSAFEELRATMRNISEKLEYISSNHSATNESPLIDLLMEIKNSITEQASSLKAAVEQNVSQHDISGLQHIQQGLEKILEKLPMQAQDESNTPASVHENSDQAEAKIAAPTTQTEEQIEKFRSVIESLTDKVDRMGTVIRSAATEQLGGIEEAIDDLSERVERMNATLDTAAQTQLGAIKNALERLMEQLPHQDNGPLKVTTGAEEDLNNEEVSKMTNLQTELLQQTVADALAPLQALRTLIEESVAKSQLISPEQSDAPSQPVEITQQLDAISKQLQSIDNTTALGEHFGTVQRSLKEITAKLEAVSNPVTVDQLDAIKVAVVEAVMAAAHKDPQAPPSTRTNVEIDGSHASRVSVGLSSEQFEAVSAAVEKITKIVRDCAYREADSVLSFFGIDLEKIANTTSRYTQTEAMEVDTRGVRGDVGDKSSVLDDPRTIEQSQQDISFTSPQNQGYNPLISTSLLAQQHLTPKWALASPSPAKSARAKRRPPTGGKQHNTNSTNISNIANTTNHQGIGTGNMLQTKVGSLVKRSASEMEGKGGAEELVKSASKIPKIHSLKPSFTAALKSRPLATQSDLLRGGEHGQQQAPGSAVSGVTDGDGQKTTGTRMFVPFSFRN
ncbi:uncharacterized protein VTP21DRAFT_7935 [Calcarisporiella thermophila]|uniref:uncharacterized protein n=1 Tax=Calcarisporiella thermophila TaxID=911321 RepID=UPI0037423173